MALHILEAIEHEVANLKTHGPRAFLDWTHLDKIISDGRKELTGDAGDVEHAADDVEKVADTAEVAATAASQPAAAVAASVVHDIAKDVAADASKVADKPATARPGPVPDVAGKDLAAASQPAQPAPAAKASDAPKAS